MNFQKIYIKLSYKVLYKVLYKASNCEAKLHKTVERSQNSFGTILK